jgi:hypothetical protein
MVNHSKESRKPILAIPPSGKKINRRKQRGSETMTDGYNERGLIPKMIWMALRHLALMKSILNASKNSVLNFR